MAKDYKFLHNLTDNQLERLLRNTLEEDVSDIEYINYILEILENREKGKVFSNLSDIHKSWDEFQKLYNVDDAERTSLYDLPVDRSLDNQLSLPLKKEKRLISKILLAAIITCFCLSIGVSAFGYDIYQAIAQWTKEVFSFGYIQSNYPPADDFDEQYNIQAFENIQDALDELSISVVKAPAYIPNGFELIEVTLLPHLSSKEIEALYAFEELTIRISVIQYDKTYNIQYEKDENVVKEVEINGITHYIFTNNGRSVATWNVNSIECSVYADITLEEMEQLVNSMY